MSDRDSHTIELFIEPLTKRETEILFLLADNLSNREIAERLTLALTSVKWYARQIYSKLGVDNRRQAVIRAKDLGLLSSGEIRTETRHNLPAQVTPFVGRQNEIHTIEGLLLESHCRLLTLTGPGGIGKTRLALQAAERLLPAFPKGARFVPLDPLASPEFLVEAVGTALELSFLGQVPPREQLLESLRRKELLLLLDNFEHLLPQGTELLIEILYKAPGVKLLITSRERLNLQAEWVLEVHGLDYPKYGQGGAVEAYPAAALFLQHARRAAGISLADDVGDCVARITRLVEGMPLALELAAAWARVISCREIADEIEQGLDFLQARQPDLPERHRSMQAVFAHSWRLLSEEERSVFCKLAVFRGGFEREAAGQVAGAFLAALASLVDKSLIYRRPDGRYRLHELLRQFAEEELEAVGETRPTRERHLAYFLDLAERAGPELWRAQEKDWLDRLEREHDNLRAALEWSLSPLSGLGVQAGQRLVAAIELYWGRRGHLAEVAGWMATILAQPQAAEDPKLYANSLRHSAWLKKQVTGEPEAARADLERSLAIAEAVGDPLTLARVLSDIGVFQIFWGDLAAGEKSLERSLALHRELGNEPGIATAVRRMGYIPRLKNDHSTARSYIEQSLQVWKALGSRSNMARTLLELASSYSEAGQYAEARGILEKSLALSREVNDLFAVALALNDLSVPVFLAGEYPLAIAYLEESLALARDTGMKHVIDWNLYNLGEIARYKGDNPKALASYQEALGIFQELDVKEAQELVFVSEAFVYLRLGDEGRAREFFKESLRLNRGHFAVAWTFGRFLIGLAGLSVMSEKPERAARLLGAVETWIESNSIPFANNWFDYPDYERFLAQARAQLDESTFSRLSQEGRALAAEGLDPILAYAQQDI